ncbi:conserved exported hypothetical protein [Bradyrhizobium sp. ORS 375]|uniref:hypothetical protein n=1 Tax=Bradyrhizobium sp. (strain ORS 375) TaxID=566679 RepID=UPI0002409BEC|nr:hypothetical protein [Bradyrhizobium sp. ORS 375]CCD92819.1 conserved exported hypothetical protein [Bradyrhizobium sp. ORS 375]
MIEFNPRAMPLRLALATAVLLPVTAFAETPMTARQMLAHAQTQALNLPGEIKKPELDKNDRIGSEAVGPPAAATTIAAPLAVIEPPAPQPTTLSALAAPAALPEPVAAQTRTNSLTAAAPTVEAVKPANAAAAMHPVATAAETRVPTPATPPVAATPPLATPPVVAPAVAPTPPSAPVATAVPTPQAQTAPTPSSAAKPAKAQRPANTAPARVAHHSAPRSSARSDDAAIGSQISRIMRRPEVQALMSQYGLE